MRRKGLLWGCVIALLVLAVSPICAVPDESTLTATRIISTGIVGNDLKILKKTGQYQVFCYGIATASKVDAWGKLAVFATHAGYGSIPKYSLRVQYADTPPSPDLTAPYRLPERGAEGPWTGVQVISALDQTMAAITSANPGSEVRSIAFPVRFAEDLWTRIKPQMHDQMCVLKGNSYLKCDQLTSCLVDAIRNDRITTEIQSMVRRHGYKVEDAADVFWEALLIRRECLGRPWSELAERDDLGLEPIVVNYSLERTGIQGRLTNKVRKEADR
jgi:hypothetical protein